MNGTKEALITAVYLKKLGGDLDGMADKCSPSSIALARAFIKKFVVQSNVTNLRFTEVDGEPVLAVKTDKCRAAINFPCVGSWEDVLVAIWPVSGESEHHQHVLRSIA